MMFDMTGAMARLAELDALYNQLWQVSGMQPEALLEMFQEGYVLESPEYVTIEDFVAEDD